MTAAMAAMVAADNSAALAAVADVARTGHVPIPEATTPLAKMMPGTGVAVAMAGVAGMVVQVQVAPEDLPSEFCLAGVLRSRRPGASSAWVMQVRAA